jgi:hypothetical protein
MKNERLGSALGIVVTDDCTWCGRSTNLTLKRYFHDYFTL